jgi:DNA-binding MarR family transcriptional regulator
MKSKKTNEELGYLIKEVQQELRKKMDKSLSEIELTTPQYAVLVFLKENPGISNAELARRSFVTPQTMNLIVQNLESRSIVTRKNSKTNGKVLQSSTTLKGKLLLEKADKLVNVIQDDIFGKLTPEEMLLLSSLLSKLKTVKGK